MSSPTLAPRRFVALAFADELVGDPSLLADFGSHFGADDDITLAIWAPGRDPNEVVAELGPQLEVDADLILLADAGDRAPEVDFLYGREPVAPSFAAFPRAHDARSLRRIVEAPDEFLVPWLLSPTPPWAALDTTDVDVPGMITVEEQQYFRWIGARYQGLGEAIELGPWLGCSTHHIAAGLRPNPTWAGRKLFVYDDFVWRSAWMDGYYDEADRPEQHGDFKFIFDRLAAPIAHEIDARKVKFIDYDGNESLPQLVWTRGAIEIMYIDCGRTFEANEAWWQIFSPHFIPGKTLVIMQDWQLYKEEPKQWYNQTKEFTDSKGAALELVHELRTGAIGTFLYHGDGPAPEPVRPAVQIALPSEPATPTVADLLRLTEPEFHTWAGAPVSWHNREVMDTLEQLLEPGMRTLETGSGHSTVIFAGKGCNHTAVTPEASEAEQILEFCRAQGFSEPTFVVGSSVYVLPTLDGELDAVYVDGAHAWPFPVVDWFYASRLLKVGGLMVIDDTDIMACFLTKQFMEVDWHWERIAGAPTWAIYRKLGDYDYIPHDCWGAQPFSETKIDGPEGFLASVWPGAVVAPAPAPAPIEPSAARFALHFAVEPADDAAAVPSSGQVFDLLTGPGGFAIYDNAGNGPYDRAEFAAGGSDTWTAVPERAPSASTSRAATTGRCVVVAGMHRSGTSATARTIDLLGVTAGPASGLVEAAEDNPTGFWESKELVELNEAVLAARGGSWCDAPEWQGWETDVALAPLYDRARELVDRYASAGDWVWKDPRLCLTLPFWRRVLGDPVVVVPVRNPLEVCRSLESRNGLGKQLALAVWERHVRRTLTDAEGLPVHVLRYEDLLARPAETVPALAAFLRANGFDAADGSPELASFLDGDLRHSAFSFDDLLCDPDVSVEQQQLYSLLDGAVGSTARWTCDGLPRETPTTEALLDLKRKLDLAHNG